MATTEYLVEFANGHFCLTRQEWLFFFYQSFAKKFCPIRWRKDKPTNRAKEKNMYKKDNPTQTKVQVNGRTIGTIEGGIFKKTIKGSKHILRCCGIAFSLDALRQAARVGFTAFEVTDRETGTVYTVDRATFETYSEPVHFAGFDAQRALSLQYWAVSLPQKSKTLKAGEVRYTRAAKPRAALRQIDFYSR